jgi:hypothetical protein
MVDSSRTPVCEKRPDSSITIIDSVKLKPVTEIKITPSFESGDRVFIQFVFPVRHGKLNPTSMLISRAIPFFISSLLQPINRSIIISERADHIDNPFDALNSLHLFQGFGHRFSFKF